ncbi:MAG: hypothetical protein JXP37_10820 [Coriobacteriia bacterium]|nr:hypothetical protein [Coriobacteriia bacterium]
MAVVFALLICMSLVGCSPASEPHPAVERVDELLQLRRDDVRDAAAYEEFFADPRFAASLAQASTEPTGTPRVPPYEPPYLAAETTSTADVAVVWRADDAFPDWPAANVFRLALEDGRWVIVDAIEADPAPEPLDGASR